MRDRDVIDMMERCAEEIQCQRMRIEQLTPKAEAYDAICSILGLLPQKGRAMGEDLVWRLRKEAQEMRGKLDKVAETEEA